MYRHWRKDTQLLAPSTADIIRNAAGRIDATTARGQMALSVLAHARDYMDGYLIDRPEHLRASWQLQFSE